MNRILITWNYRIQMCTVYWFNDNDEVVSCTEKKVSQATKIIQAQMKLAGSGSSFPVKDFDANLYSFPASSIPSEEEIDCLSKKALRYKRGQIFFPSQQELF